MRYPPKIYRFCLLKAKLKIVQLTSVLCRCCRCCKAMGCIILSPSCSRLQIEPKKLCPSYAQTIAAQRMPTDLGCDASTHSVQNECEHEAKSFPPWWIGSNAGVPWWTSKPDQWSGFLPWRNFFSTRKFVGSKFHTNRRLPDVFAFDLDTFLLMNYNVVQNAWHFGLVRTCAICMEDHLSIFEPFLSNWFPIDCE